MHREYIEGETENGMKTPRNEIVWTRYHDADGNERFIVTSKPSRDIYYLYETVGDAYVRVGKGMTSPIDLENKHGVADRIGIGK